MATPMHIATITRPEMVAGTDPTRLWQLISPAMRWPAPGTKPRKSGFSGHEETGLKATLRLGVGGPVGAGKTTLVELLCRRLRDRSDLLVINKIDLAPHVGASLEVMAWDTARMRGEAPYVFASLKAGEGLDEIVAFIVREGMLDTGAPIDRPAEESSLTPVGAG